MIEVKDGNLHLKGTGNELLADLSCIVHGLKDDLDVNMINVAVDLGLKDEQELEKLSRNAMKELKKLKKLNDELKKMNDELKGEE